MDSVQSNLISNALPGRSAVPAAGRAVVRAEPVAAPSPVAVQVSADIPPAVSQDLMEEAANRIKTFLQQSPASPANLEFAVDNNSGRVLLRIMDSDTKQMLLQLPSEETLAIARALDRFKGLFVQQKA